MGLFILRYAVERLHGRAPPVGNAETGGALT